MLSQSQFAHMMNTHCSSAKKFAGCKKIIACVCLTRSYWRMDVCEVQVLIFIFKWAFCLKNSITEPHKLLTFSFSSFLGFLWKLFFPTKCSLKTIDPVSSTEDLKQNAEHETPRSYLMQTTHLCWWIYIFCLCFSDSLCRSNGRTKGENFWFRKPSIIR